MGFSAQNFSKRTFSQVNLQRYADAIYAKGAPLKNCWGFIDENARPISRPGINHRVLYNGHKRVHAIKFQSAASPDGLVAFLHGQFEGRRHNSGMLRDWAPVVT